MLIEAGLLEAPILYLSRAIIARKNDYYRLLRAVTAEQAWIEWILYMLDVVRESAVSTTRKIGAIRDCQNDIAARARSATTGGRDARFLDLLFGQPYCRISTVVERCEVSRQTASTWLHALVKAELLADVKVRPRGPLRQPRVPPHPQPNRVASELRLGLMAEQSRRAGTARH